MEIFAYNARVCVWTSGFPALFTQVMNQQGLTTFEYFGYLGLYNLAYVADDAVMVAIAVVTLSHRKLQARKGRWLKNEQRVGDAGIGYPSAVRSNPIILS